MVGPWPSRADYAKRLQQLIIKSGLRQGTFVDAELYLTLTHTQEGSIDQLVIKVTPTRGPLYMLDDVFVDFINEFSASKYNFILQNGEARGEMPNSGSHSVVIRDMRTNEILA